MSQYEQEKDGARVSLTAFVDPARHRELAELAQRQDRSLSSLVRLALDRYLDEQNAHAVMPLQRW